MTEKLYNKDLILKRGKGHREQEEVVESKRIQSFKEKLNEYGHRDNHTNVVQVLYAINHLNTTRETT